MPNKKYVRIVDVRGLKRFLHRLLSERYRDEIESEKTRDLVMVCKLLLELFKETDLEERIAALESELSRRRNIGGYNNG